METTQFSFRTEAQHSEIYSTFETLYSSENKLGMFWRRQLVLFLQGLVPMPFLLFLWKCTCDGENGLVKSQLIPSSTLYLAVPTAAGPGYIFSCCWWCDKPNTLQLCLIALALQWPASLLTQEPQATQSPSLDHSRKITKHKKHMCFLRCRKEVSNFTNSLFQMTVIIL